MLKRRTNPTIPCKLHIKGQGEDFTFDITFHNRKQSEVVERLKSAQEDPASGGVRDVILYLVESWDSEFPLTAAGVEEMEDERPGLIMAIIEGFHEARKSEREKN